MGNIISLSPLDLSLAGVLVLALAVLCTRIGVGLGQELLIAAARTTVQLLLIGMVLKILFAHVELSWVILLAVVMLLIAGYEVRARQSYRFTGGWSFGIGTVSLFISSFAVTVLTLTVIIGTDPWYTPQYAIPLLGMLLGNTMTGIALGVDRLTQTAIKQRAVIEAQLMVGQNWSKAIDGIRKESTRSGMIPIINAMATAGVVSLPGTMSGQILAGNSPIEAVKYQILIMFLVSAGTGFGTLSAVWLASRRLFDERERLRADRLRARLP
jgi:TIGR00245 family protein